MPIANVLPAPPPEPVAAVRGRPKVALVLGAGSLKCAAAFGVVKVLLRHSVAIDLVVGCSGGAFCAAWLAAGGHDADQGAQRFAEGWAGAFDNVDYFAVLSAVFPRLLRFNRRASWTAVRSRSCGGSAASATSPSPRW